MPQRPRRAVLARSIVAALLLTLIGALPAGAAPPDRLIVFDSDRGGQVDLWTMRSDGSGLARLTNDKVPDELAEWSPNRKQIAWTRGGELSPAGEIWVMNADGTGRRQVTSNTFSDNAVAWSPDGRQLAYRSDRDGNRDIYVIGVDGTNERQLTTDPATDWLPDWSPDGTRITFTRTSERSGVSAIYTMSSADGSDVRQLTDDSLGAGLSVYSPDGSRIAFADNLAGPGEKDVWVMNADGSGLRQVTNTADLELPHSWSPDGTRVAAEFARVTQSTVGKGDIAVVTVATAATVNLTNTSGVTEDGPDWQP
jgi:Tol biopolymer transport system component